MDRPCSDVQCKAAGYPLHSHLSDLISPPVRHRVPSGSERPILGTRRRKVSDKFNTDESACNTALGEIKTITTTHVVGSQERFIILPGSACQLENAELNTWHMTKKQSVNPQHCLPLQLDTQRGRCHSQCLTLHISYMVQKDVNIRCGWRHTFEPSLPLLPGVKTFLQSQHKDS